MRPPPTTLAFITIAALAGCSDDPAPPPPPAPVTQAATQPATQPVAEAPPEPFDDYLDVARDDDPDLPTTQPLDRPLVVDEAARLTFDEPTLLDAVGRLWITHPRGRTPDQILAGDLKQQTHVIDRPIHFSWWKVGYAGEPTVEMILEKPGGGLVWHHALGVADVPALPDGREYDWDAAFAYDESIVVPTTGGAAVLTPVDRPDLDDYMRRYAGRDSSRRPDASGTVEVRHVALAGPRDDLPQTQIRLDGVGLIAWVPHESDDRPGGGIARFDNDDWSKLEGDAWASRPVHLMPLADGSIMQLALNDDGEATLSAVPLNAGAVDEAEVERLVEGLGDSDPQVRETSFAALAGYGPGAWPTMNRLIQGRPRFVQKQLALLLGDQTRPSLGGLRPEAGPVEVRDRLADGGVILSFPKGIRLPDDLGITVLQRPAYLAVRPGRRTRLLDADIAAEVEADADTHVAVWGDEWVVSRPGQPPKRWLVNHFEPLLEEERADWQHFVGIDAAGRWLFRKSDEGRPTLLVDVRVADPTPKLPAWTLPVGEGGVAGWDEEGWPVIKAGGAWRLKEQDWEPRGEDAEVVNDPPANRGDALAVGPDGSEYRGGITELRVKRPDGSEVVWPLPPEVAGFAATPPPKKGVRPIIDAAGKLDLPELSAKAVIDAKGRVFLFNRPGRVVRIDPTREGAAEPFEVAGVFEPSSMPTAAPRRAWIDPSGRLCALFFDDTVTVMWPEGRVPPSIREKMPVEDRYQRGGGGDMRQGI